MTEMTVTVLRQAPGTNMRTTQCGKRPFAIVFPSGRRFRIFADSDEQAELYRRTWFPDCRLENDE